MLILFDNKGCVKDRHVNPDVQRSLQNCFIPGVATFFPKGQINYYTTVRGSDILRYVIVSRYVSFYQVNKVSQIYCFFINGQIGLHTGELVSRVGWNGSADRIWPAGRSLDT